MCNLQPECCDVAWTQGCADRASEICGECIPPPLNDDCADAIAIFDGDTAIDTTTATTDGPAHAVCQFDGQTYNDIWFNYTATCSQNLTVSTCGQAQYDTDLAVYDGCGCPVGDADLLGCSDDAVGCADFTSELTLPVASGNCYKIRIGGFNPNDFGTGTVTITCGQ